LDTVFIYQLDFVTPGISPLWASFLKQILQSPKSLKNPLGLPHSLHLLRYFTAYFIGFLIFATHAVVAMLTPEFRSTF